MKKKKFIVCLMLTVFMVNIMHMTVLAESADTDERTINGITYESILGVSAGYAQANTFASSGSVGNIAMWGLMYHQVTDEAFNFNSSHCVTSRESNSHYRIHICASCDLYRMSYANSTHYFANTSVRLYAAA